MIKCIPKSICSWDFTLSSQGYLANVSFNWFGESGLIVINEQTYIIEKQGIMSSKWVLKHNGSERAFAYRKGIFSKTILLNYDDYFLELSSLSFWGRGMKLYGNKYNAEISPTHSLTKRAKIIGVWEDDVILAFGFWLTVSTWRRTASS